MIGIVRPHLQPVREPLPAACFFGGGLERGLRLFIEGMHRGDPP